MKIFKNIKGSMSAVPNIEVNIDTVYIRENVKRIETEDFNGWEYDETQMTLQEYQESESSLLRREQQRREELEEIVMILTSEI